MMRNKNYSYPWLMHQVLKYVNLTQPLCRRPRTSGHIFREVGNDGFAVPYSHGKECLFYSSLIFCFYMYAYPYYSLLFQGTNLAFLDSSSLDCNDFIFLFWFLQCSFIVLQVLLREKEDGGHDEKPSSLSILYFEENQWLCFKHCSAVPCPCLYLSGSFNH
ncbi:uncharacterized protein J3R85_017451 [Psidium guajava]|nr:uncharacterized protein J3R85_017451 [Psidium guajava]